MFNDDSSRFFHRSLSPDSFERLRTENNDYFYKPKRGPSTSKSNITITRPIKPVEHVSTIVQLIFNRSTKIDDQRLTSQSSSFISVDANDFSSLTSSSSSVFSSRSNSSISTVAEQETQVVTIEEPLDLLNSTGSDPKISFFNTIID